MNDQPRQLTNAIQTVIVLIAIPLGLIPLIQAIFGFDQSGVFQFVFSDPAGSARWVIPIVVIVVAAVIVMAVEHLPKGIGGEGGA